MQSSHSHIIKLINTLLSSILAQETIHTMQAHQNLCFLQYARYLQKGPTTNKHLYNLQLYKLLKSASGHWLCCDCCLPHPRCFVANITETPFFSKAVKIVVTFQSVCGCFHGFHHSLLTLSWFMLFQILSNDGCALQISSSLFLHQDNLI